MSTVRVVVEGFESPEEAAGLAGMVQTAMGRFADKAPAALAVEVDGKRLIFTGFPGWDAAVAYGQWFANGSPDRIIVETEEVQFVSYGQGHRSQFVKVAKAGRS